MRLALRFAAALAVVLAAVLFLSCASGASSPAAREWYDLGNAWLDKSDWKRAGEAYSRALALDPSLAGASFNLARALAQAGDYEGALRVLDSLAAKDPQNLRVIAARAYALYKKGDTKAALTAYRRAVDLDPYASDAVYNIALLELAAGDAAAATDDLARLTSAKSEDGQAFLLLGRALDKVGGREEAALAAYEKAKTLGKADADGLERLAALYEASRRYADEMDSLEAAVKLDPKRAAAWFSLARLRLVVAFDADKGLDALKSALDAGFSDKDAAKALLDEPDLPEREKVFAVLNTKNLAE
jgi:tetratricopeptide (TPR) repeat protein